MKTFSDRVSERLIHHYKNGSRTGAFLRFVERNYNLIGPVGMAMIVMLVILLGILVR